MIIYNEYKIFFVLYIMYESRMKRVRRESKRNNIQPKKGDIMVWNGTDWEPSGILTELSKIVHLKDNYCISQDTNPTTDDSKRLIDEIDKKLNDLINDLYI